jgi:mannose-6-phosphate isomerase-like protein (cupin superfamily)
MYHVERAGQNKFDYTNLHDGTGEILVQRYFENLHDWKCDIDIWELAPGVTEGAHTHDESDPEYGLMDEIYVVLDGRAEMTIDGSIESLDRGDAVICKAGANHSLKNIGDSVLRVLFISDPEIK